MYRVAWSPIPHRNDWLLRCTESGAAYPNGRQPGGGFMVGQHPKRFPDAERAFRYAEKYGIEVAAGAVPGAVTQPQNGEQ